MSNDYTYDEQGEFFPYFVLIVAGVITMPTTYSALKPGKELENTASKIPSDFHPDHEDLISNQRRKQKRKERRFKRGFVAVIGWILMAAMVYLMIITTRSIPKIWDPYEILDISRSASESQIRKHYKKLSITQHPDKRKPDPAKNETLDTINDHWVDVTKAFKTLTDEDVRNNYIQYGHPDGKQSFSIGIALPKFFIAEGSGKYVLFLYALLLGVVLPFFVGRWWYGTQRMTRDGILVATAGKLFREYKDDITEGGVVNALSSGAEYNDALGQNKRGADSDRIESRVLKEDESAKKTISRGSRDSLLGIDDKQRRKALGLLMAYLHRVDLKDPLLDEQKYEVAPMAFVLNEALQNMSLAFGNTSPLLATCHTSQNLIQALPQHASPLLQLPYFNPSVIQSLQSSAPDLTKSVQAFMSLSESRRRNLAVNSRLLTMAQYNTAMAVAAQLPLARVERAFFKVTGERHVTPGSLVQFVVKLRIIPPGTEENAIPPVKPSDLEDPDPKEGDLEALHGRKKSTQGANKGGDGKDQSSDGKVQPPLAHAPFYARDHSPRWRVFLADHKTGKIAVPPFTFSTFDNPIFEDASNPASSPPPTPGASDAPPSPTMKRKHRRGSSLVHPVNEKPRPTCAVQTLRMQFQAPPQVGEYPFRMHMICDSYKGLDSVQDVSMYVKDMAEAEEIESEEEASEPEEDSIAGQMNALRGAASGSPTDEKPKHKKVAKKVEEAKDDDSSDTEGEHGESDSDSDTDTETDTDSESDDEEEEE